MSSKKIPEWFLKESAIIEPEKNITATGNSTKQWNKHTPCIRGIERRPIWQKCSLARHCALTYIFSFIPPYNRMRQAVLLSPILSIRKLKLREVKKLTQSHKVNKWRSLPILWSILNFQLYSFLKLTCRVCGLLLLLTSPFKSLSLNRVKPLTHPKSYKSALPQGTKHRDHSRMPCSCGESYECQQEILKGAVPYFI